MASPCAESSDPSAEDSVGSVGRRFVDRERRFCRYSATVCIGTWLKKNEFGVGKAIRFKKLCSFHQYPKCNLSILSIFRLQFFVIG